MAYGKPRKGNIKLTLSIKEELLKQYKKFCEKEGFSLSGQVEKFMRSQMKDKNVWEYFFKK